MVQLVGRQSVGHEDGIYEEYGSHSGAQIDGTQVVIACGLGGIFPGSGATDGMVDAGIAPGVS